MTTGSCDAFSKCTAQSMLKCKRLLLPVNFCGYILFIKQFLSLQTQNQNRTRETLPVNLTSSWRPTTLGQRSATKLSLRLRQLENLCLSLNGGCPVLWRSSADFTIINRVYKYHQRAMQVTQMKHYLMKSSAL